MPKLSPNNSQSENPTDQIYKDAVKQEIRISLWDLINSSV